MSVELRGVSIVGIGQIPVQKATPAALREKGVAALKLAITDTRVDQINALFMGNMLASNL